MHAYLGKIVCYIQGQKTCAFSEGTDGADRKRIRTRTVGQRGANFNRDMEC